MIKRFEEGLARLRALKVPEELREEVAQMLQMGESMKGELESQERVEEQLHRILEMITRVTARDFEHRLEIPESNKAFNSFESIAVGLNMLAEELQFSVVSRDDLESQKTFLQAMIDASPALVFAKDLQGRYTHVNQAFLSEYRLETKNVIGRTAFDFFPKFVAERMQRNDQEVMNSGKFKLFEELIPTEEGFHWVQTSLYPLLDSKGRMSGMCGQVLDIHESKITKRFQKSILSAIDSFAMVSITNADGKITFVNDQFAKTSGYSLEELVGQDHRLLNSGYHSQEFMHSLWSTIQLGQIWRGEIRNRRKDGTHYWSNTTITPFAGVHQETQYIEIAIDITAEKSMQQQLVNSAKMASLGEMAGSIAHEINNPLTIIQGKALQLNRRLESQEKVEGELVKEFHQELDKISETVERIAKIIRGLRTFSRNAHSDPFIEAPLSRIVSDTLELCRERFRNHGIELRVNIPEDIVLDCRPTQISQVLMNLLSNAHDAVESLSVRWVEVSVVRVEDKLQIAVTDSGKGIPDQVAELIMNPFFSTKEVGRGTGLGLSISKAIAEDHGGTLRYDRSSPHTRFVLELAIRQKERVGKAA